MIESCGLCRDGDGSVFGFCFSSDRVEGILQLCTVWEGLLFVGWIDDNEDFFTLSLTDVCQRILVFLCINELDGSAA